MSSRTENQAMHRPVTVGAKRLPVANLVAQRGIVRPSLEVMRVQRDAAAPSAVLASPVVAPKYRVTPLFVLNAVPQQDARVACGIAITIAPSARAQTRPASTAPGAIAASPFGKYGTNDRVLLPAAQACMRNRGVGSIGTVARTVLPFADCQCAGLDRKGLSAMSAVLSQCFPLPPRCLLANTNALGTRLRAVQSRQVTGEEEFTTTGTRSRVLRLGVSSIASAGAMFPLAVLGAGSAAEENHAAVLAGVGRAWGILGAHDEPLIRCATPPAVLAARGLHRAEKYSISRMGKG